MTSPSLWFRDCHPVSPVSLEREPTPIFDAVRAAIEGSPEPGITRFCWPQADHEPQ